jgi:hypothetical protein
MTFTVLSPDRFALHLSVLEDTSNLDTLRCQIPTPPNSVPIRFFHRGAPVTQRSQFPLEGSTITSLPPFEFPEKTFPHSDFAFTFDGHRFPDHPFPDDFPYLPTPPCFVLVANPPNEDFARMRPMGQPPAGPAQPAVPDEEDDLDPTTKPSTEEADYAQEWRDWFAATLTDDELRIVDRLSELGFERSLAITQLFMAEGDEIVAREALEKILKQME